MASEIQTDDLALATVLVLRGFEPDRLEMDGDVALFVFIDGGRAKRIVQSYEAGNCLVEPKNYNLCLRRTRRRLFDFLGSHGIKPRPAQRV